MSNELPTTVTVPANYAVRIFAQTASRDYTAPAVPGTYAIEYTTVNYHPVPAGERPYYARVRVAVVSPERVESAAEFGGVCYATRTVEAETHEHVINMYAYEVRGKDARGALAL